MDVYKFKKGINLEPQSTTSVLVEGDVAFRDDNKQLEVHNGTSVENITTSSNTQTLTNKSISANQITGLSSSAGPTNWLINSAFDFSQEYAGNGATASGGGSPVYGVDQWYTDPSFGGTAGSCTFSPLQTGTEAGSTYSLGLYMTGAPTGSPSRGVALYQTLENQDSSFLYNKTISFSINVLAINNINQVGIQLMYRTTEGKITNSSSTLGSETLVTVNSSTNTLCSINSQAVGTSMTKAGVIGVRIRVTGVSSGNVWDAGNGFTVEQAMLNIGTTPAPFLRRGVNLSHELQLCQRFYTTSYDSWSNSSNPITGGQPRDALSGSICKSSGGSNIFVGVRFPVMMREVRQSTNFPIITFYSQSNTPGSVSNSAGTNITTTGTNNTTSCLGFNQITISPSATVSDNYSFFYTADARL